MSSHKKPIVKVTYPGDEGYRTKLDPEHASFDKSLITDPQWLREHDGHNEDWSEFSQTPDEEEDKPSDPDIEPDERSVTVDAVVSVLEADEDYGPLMRMGAIKRQLQHGKLFFDGLKTKAYEITYDADLAQEVVEWLKVRDALVSSGKSSGIRSMGIGEFFDLEYPPLKWIIEGLLPHGGALAIHAAYAKSGKSTLVAGQIKSIVTGTPFCGLPTTQVPILYLNMEEREADVQRRLRDEFKIPRDGKRFRIMFERERWGARLRDTIAEHVVKYGTELLYVDTLAKLWDIEDENDNAEVSGWMSEFQAFVHKLGVTTVINHHAGKAGGSHGTSLRGASAIAGDCDLFWEFGRVESKKGVSEATRKTLRQLSASGRYRLEDELLIQFDPLTCEYTRFTGLQQAQAENAGPDIVSDMLLSGEPQTLEEVVSASSKSLATVKRRLDQLVGEGYVKTVIGKDDLGHQLFVLSR